MVFDARLRSRSSAKGRISATSASPMRSSSGTLAQLDGQPSIMSMRGWDLAENDIETVVAVTRIRRQGNTTFGSTRSNPGLSAIPMWARRGFVLPVRSPRFRCCPQKQVGVRTYPGNPEVAIRTPTLPTDAVPMASMRLRTGPSFFRSKQQGFEVASIRFPNVLHGVLRRPSCRARHAPHAEVEIHPVLSASALWSPRSPQAFLSPPPVVPCQPLAPPRHWASEAHLVVRPCRHRAEVLVLVSPYPSMQLSLFGSSWRLLGPFPWRQPRAASLWANWQPVQRRQVTPCRR